MKNANSTRLIGHPLDKDLGTALGRTCASPTTRTASRCPKQPTARQRVADIVFGIIAGTGVGGGVCVGGRVLTGAHAIAGEWGHNPLPAPRDR